jgi:hypothetical protein
LLGLIKRQTMFAGNEDTSAVVLTLGEPSTQRAIESISCQTLPVREVIIVRDVRPWHAALNEGASRVKAPYFVQVDSDMILDPGCVSALREAARDDTGVVVGYLRDQLIGEVVGIKLYRTACFRTIKVPDCIGPDVAFNRAIGKIGWKTQWVGKPRFGRSSSTTTLGVHRPCYTGSYTYTKLLMQARRYRYWGDISGIQWHFGRLEASSHPLALLASIALARGIFLDLERDQLGVFSAEDEFDAIDAFLRSPGTVLDRVPGDPPHRAPAVEVFGLYYRAGSRMRLGGGSAAFTRLMGALKTRNDDPAWIAKVGLCRGLLAEIPNEAEIERDFRLLRDFFSHGTLRRKIGQRLRRLAAPRGIRLTPG